ncbi:hypothetical protein [Paracoccus suum]|uniref:hypothetical protein n=1 Tax=Paracoccus suum TaxID=2259340 RepID=UPI0013B04D8B|nr:hypothetical protein [Paracoccus suum]
MMGWGPCQTGLCSLWELAASWDVYSRANGFKPGSGSNTSADSLTEAQLRAMGIEGF